MNLLNLYFSNKKEVAPPVTETWPFIVVSKIGVQGVHRGSYNFRQNCCKRSSFHLDPPPNWPLHHLDDFLSLRLRLLLNFLLGLQNVFNHNVLLSPAFLAAVHLGNAPDAKSSQRLSQPTKFGAKSCRVFGPISRGYVAFIIV